jgi:phytoene dehydrogenase-like protein
MRRGAHEGYESKLDAVLDRVPSFKAVTPEVAKVHGVDQSMAATMMVAPSLAEMARNHRLLGEGRIGDRPVFYANVPSVLDPSLASPDEHVFSLEALFTPYSLSGGWAGSAEPYRWLEQVATLMEPGFLESIKRWRLVGPREYETDFRLRKGYAPSFSGGPLAALRGRDPELTRYRTSVAGLYLTGAATFPGAGVWGASGRNVAAVVVSDLA